MSVDSHGEVDKFNYKAIKRILVTEKVCIWNLDRIFIPIHLDNSHWIFCCLDIEKKTISAFDSLNSNSNEKNKMLRGICSNLIRWLELELIESKVRITSIPYPFYIENPVRRESTITKIAFIVSSIKSFTIHIPATPQQQNSNDCGFFVLVNMFASLFEVTEERRNKWGANVITSARRTFATYLKFRKECDSNEEFDPNVLFDQLDLESNAI